MEREIRKSEEEEEVRIWSWGAGTDGQLGTGSSQDELFPQSVYLKFNSKISISQISCGGAHSVALTVEIIPSYRAIDWTFTAFSYNPSAGRVFTWGRGTKGQLGHKEPFNCLRPTLVKSLENFTISNVSAGWNHSGFVANTGRLFMCGDGSFGQLGNGDLQSYVIPTEVSYFNSKYVEQIACGMRHSLALVRGLDKNTIYGFGSARHGQIGVSESGTQRLRPCNYNPNKIHGFGNHKIVNVYANGDQSAALTDDQHLYTWGRGFSGSLSNHSPCIFPSTLKFSQIALGWDHALLLSDGDVYMLGGKHHGLLNVTQNIKKAQKPSTSSVQHAADVSPTLPPTARVYSRKGEKVMCVAAGAEHSAILTENGKIMTWGWGEHGQLGHGDTNDLTSPTEVKIQYNVHINAAQFGIFCGSGFTLVVKLS